MEGGRSLIPCRVEIQCPQNDWSKSWSLERLKGLSSASMSFLWKLLHQLLPTRERQHRILRDGDGALCGVCNNGEIDSLEHALASCADSRETFEWLKQGLRKFSPDISTDQILKLDISRPNQQDNEMPLIWFTAEVLKQVWEVRASGKPCRSTYVQAEVKAEWEMLKLSKYKQEATIVELMF